MIKNWRFLFIPSLLFFAITVQAPAYALFMEVNPVVLLNAAAPTQKQNGGSLRWTGDTANGFGMFTSVDLFSSRFDVEVGAVYLAQLSERVSAGSILKQETHNLHL